MTTTLFVTWDRTRVSVLQADTAHTPRLTAAWTAPWPETFQPLLQPEMAGKWLADQWRTAGLTAKPLHIVLPREDVVLRHLELPQAPDDELADLVRFQAASRSTLPIDQLSLDYVPLSSVIGREGRDVLAITVPKSAVESIRKLALNAERELTGISFSAHALGEWGEQVDRRLLKTRLDNSNESTVVIAIEQDRVELSVVTGRELTFAHAARIVLEEGQSSTPVILAEVSRTLMAGQRLRPGLRVDHGWLIGGDAELAKLLGERLECLVQPVNPIKDHPQTTLLTNWHEQPVRVAILLGAASQAHPITATVNLLKPRQPPPKRDPRKQQLAIVAGLVLFLVFFFSGGSLLRLQTLDGMIEELQTSRGRLKENVDLGKKFVDHASVIGDWALRDRNQLTQLTELEALFPGGLDRPYLINYEFTVGTRDVLGDVLGTVAAQSRESMENMHDSLSEQPHYKLFTQPIEFNDRADDSKYPYRHKLVLQLPKKKLAPPAPAAVAPKNAT